MAAGDILVDLEHLQVVECLLQDGRTGVTINTSRHVVANIPPEAVKHVRDQLTAYLQEHGYDD